LYQFAKPTPTLRIDADADAAGSLLCFTAGTLRKFDVALATKRKQGDGAET
jgi:hypothetical protein